MKKRYQPIDYSKLPKAARAMMRDKGYVEWRSCYSKKQYATEEVAKAEGMRPYHCEVCGKWHRASVRK